jgi:hypothetical protein
MTTIELKPDVLEFLRTTGTVWRDGEHDEIFVVGATVYKPTNKEGFYTVEFREIQ